jgi:hypothetical protein
MGDNFGTTHAMTNHFCCKPGGIGIPDGDGNFIKSPFNLIELGEFGFDTESAPSVDGQAHTTGKEVSQEVPFRFYASDELTCRAIFAAAVAFRRGAPGHKLPYVIESRQADETPVRVFTWTSAAVKNWKYDAHNKDGGKPATISGNFLVFGVAPING